MGPHLVGAPTSSNTHAILNGLALAMMSLHPSLNILPHLRRVSWATGASSLTLMVKPSTNLSGLYTRAARGVSHDQSLPRENSLVIVVTAGRVTTRSFLPSSGIRMGLNGSASSART